MTALQQTVTEADYLAFEEKASLKHEFWRGRIYEMPGGSYNHMRLILNLGMTLGFALRGKTFSPVGSELQVKINATGDFVYPDAAIHGPNARFEGTGRRTLLDPIVVFEVLSPSTERHDLTDKFEAYKLIPTFSDYVVLAQNRVFVQHFHRTPDGWLQRTYTSRADVLTLPEVEVQLRLEDLYEAVNVPEGIVSLRELEADEL